jgi:hypothetical protein
LTCLRMYLRKASLDHLPNNMIVNTGTCAKYMAIAAPLLAECKPISFAVKPSESSPSVLAAKRRHLRNSDLENICFLPSGKQKRFTESAGEAPG